ncbi:hypothetical protein GOBAR_AA19403 [Gossypium barbadense]|uniref:Uncharacterized protein n=1 Tax=Gossypium barbadense TaxID=3634 RepID=A0A2P5XD53_GOSBA|nr:hypothetical protein GOBAR_AA19403 [Gossypium barbadense]
MSYFAPNVATLILQWVQIEAHVWCINTLVLNLSTVECYSVEHQRYMALWNARRRNQPMVEPDPKDQHMVEPDPEDQPLNTHTSLNQWVSAFSAMFDPTPNPPNVFSTPQHPPHQQRLINCYTPNDDTTYGSFQF